MHVAAGAGMTHIETAAVSRFIALAMLQTEGSDDPACLIASHDAGETRAVREIEA